MPKSAARRAAGKRAFKANGLAKYTAATKRIKEKYGNDAPIPSKRLKKDAKRRKEWLGFADEHDAGGKA